MKNRELNIVIPMAGLGSRFLDAGYKKPKPFIDVDGLPMIERVIQNLKIESMKYKFWLLAKKEHLKAEPQLTNHLIDNYLVNFIEVNSTTEGAACTVLHARKYIDNNNPLLIANSDQLVDCKIDDMIISTSIKNADANIMIFKEPTLNKKWSYVKLDNNGFVIETKEKNAISDCATVGIYYFNKGIDFVNSALDMIVRNDRSNNEFYVCPAFNYLILNGGKIITHEICKEEMHGLGTPEDLDSYISNKDKK
jgi:dTDP-glucose pyrophosphorylase